jgi:polyhydroxybutyrate depolymerase
MHRSAALVRPCTLVLALAGALLAPGCGGGAGAPGAGGAGGGAATGGATAGTDTSAPAQGGGGTGAGGTTTSPKLGGAPGSGGTNTNVAASGGTIAMGSGGRSGNGGTPGRGGTPGTGGTSPSGGGGVGRATGGRTGSGGATEIGDAGVGDTTDAGPGSDDGGQPTAVPSLGCGIKSNPQSGRFNLTVGSATREYIIKLPDNYDTNRPYRLVFGFHGAKYNDDWVATGKAPDGGTALSGPYFGLESEAAGSAIFVAPQAASGWSANDLPFVDAMLELFQSQLCIDKSRIFSVGFSMGAIMTLTLACNRSEVFRAVAPMSGSLPSPCPAGRPIAYWAAHGTSDTTIRMSEGQAARDEFVERNHCGTPTSSPDEHNCVTYPGCDQGYPVTWCTFAGAHDPAPFAGPAIWKFLAPL